MRLNGFPSSHGFFRLSDCRRPIVSGYFRAGNTASFLHLIEAGLEVKSEPRGDIISLRRALR